MGDLFYLTQKDRDLLDKLAGMFLGQPTPNGPYDPEPELARSPDIYIALVPTGGIPPMTDNDGSGDSELTVGDKPGSANCKIFRIVDGEMKYCGMEKRVYNISSAIIPEGWITIRRDSYGTWLSEAGMELYEGILDEDLDAADDTQSSPATAVANRYGLEDGELVEKGPVTIVNRDTTLTLERRTYIIYGRVNGELKILWAACAPEASSSSS